MNRNSVWITEYTAWQAYDLVDRLAKAIYPTCVWHCSCGGTGVRTARAWAEWMVSALRNGRDL